MISLLCLALVMGETGAAKPQVVYVGAYLHHIPEIDLKSNTYMADFYVWFRWQGQIDPTKSFELSNVADMSSLVKTMILVDAEGNPKPDLLDDGSSYQQVHVQGRFTHPFSVKNYPFDEQDVVFELEDNKSPSSELVYRVDEIGHSGVHPTLVLPGWEMQQVKLSVVDTKYETNFGDPRVQAHDTSYTHLTVKLHLKRSVWGSLVKSILPLLLILMITLSVFFIDGKYFDARVCIAITTLISAVALQLTSGTEIPSVGYVVLLDKLYNLSYAVISYSLLESVLAVRLSDLDQSARAAKYDAISLAGSVVLSVGYGAWLILAR